MKGPTLVAVAERKPYAEMLKTHKGDNKLKEKASRIKNPDPPKRPQCSFLIFMEDFRKAFKKQNPDDKSLGTVGKAGREKWKSMTDSERAPYLEKAASRREANEEALEAYKKLIDSSASVFEDSLKTSTSEIY